MTAIPQGLDSEFDRYLGGDLMASEPDQVVAAVKASLAYLERETGKRLQPVASKVWHLSGGLRGRRTILLPQEPASVSEVAEWNSSSESYDILTGGTDYSLDGRRLRRLGHRYFPSGALAVRVSGTAGFDNAGDMDSDVKGLIFELAAAEIRGRSTERPSVFGEDGQPTGSRLSPQWWRNLRSLRGTTGMIA